MIIWFSFFTKHLLSLFFFSLVFKTHSQFPSNIMFSIGNCYVCPRLRLRNTHNPFSSSFSCNRRQLWVSSFPLPPPPFYVMSYSPPLSFSLLSLLSFFDCCCYLDPITQAKLWFPEGKNDFVQHFFCYEFGMFLFFLSVLFFFFF